MFLFRSHVKLVGNGSVRKPETVEKLYLDFDGFFASVMQQAIPSLRGRPIGVIPFEVEGRAANSTVVIACSKEAKAYGVKNVMPVPEAKALCPDLILVPQQPDLFRRANAALLNEIKGGNVRFARPDQPVDATLYLKRMHWIFCLRAKHIAESSPRNRSRGS